NRQAHPRHVRANFCRGSPVVPIVVPIPDVSRVRTGTPRVRLSSHAMKFPLRWMIAGRNSCVCSVVFVLSLAHVPRACADDTPSIQDNSFLVEEAYNQERGVVQHISGFTYFSDSKDWAYTFTQEWPVPGLRHQLSYTLTF